LFQGTELPLPRFQHAAVALPSNFLLVFGGVTGRVDNAFDTNVTYLGDVWSVLMATPVDPLQTKIAPGDCPNSLAAGLDDECTIEARDSWGFPTGAIQFESQFRVELSLEAFDGRELTLNSPPVKYLCMLFSFYLFVFLDW